MYVHKGQERKQDKNIKKKKMQGKKVPYHLSDVRESFLERCGPDFELFSLSFFFRIIDSVSYNKCHTESFE